jgi:thioredoxin-like negative regulator of GroEL
VKVLTDDNFTSFVQGHDVVFVEFYTTTCAHCVEFSKAYDKIAKKVYSESSLGYEIVALDIKKNKKVATDLQIVSFPTFKVYVSGQPVTYEGPRTE